jgi:lipopolysaccharide biosynthesis glycosyltransferase
MNNEVLPIYIGYDPREDIAYRVCEYSIVKHNANADVKQLRLSSLRKDEIYLRENDTQGSTEFTFTRFFVPFLQNYDGWALFCDCDFVWDGDIQEIFDQRDDQYAVMVVKHEHTPTNTVKMDGKVQTQYPRKNWSSMILWNCGHPSNAKLSINDVNTQPGSFLHRFQWLEDHEIGSLNPKYNFLVGWNSEKRIGKPFAYHWTEGGPWFENYRNCEYADVWNRYLLEYSKEISYGSTQTYTPITWVTSLSREYYDYVGKVTLPTWENLPGDIVFVWDDKPLDLGFGKVYNFYRDVASTEDPWIREMMGGSKADRFWKKSRVQVWAARKFKGLVIWLDADVMVTQKLPKSKAIEIIHPQHNVWGTLDCGEDHPQQLDHIDTGIVGFNTRHLDFHEFIREYSLMWYNGEIYKCHQPYDHYVVTALSKKWKAKTYVPHFKNWGTIPDQFPNRFNMENSYLKEYFTHYLGIDRKNLLASENKKNKKEKKK